MRDQAVRHFLNDLVVGAVGLNGACVIALRGNTARNVREGCIIKSSTTDRHFAFMFFSVLFLLTIKMMWQNENEQQTWAHSD